MHLRPNCLACGCTASWLPQERPSPTKTPCRVRVTDVGPLMSFQHISAYTHRHLTARVQSTFPFERRSSVASVSIRSWAGNACPAGVRQGRSPSIGETLPEFMTVIWEHFGRVYLQREVEQYEALLSETKDRRSRKAGMLDSLDSCPWSPQDKRVQEVLEETNRIMAEIGPVSPKRLGDDIVREGLQAHKCSNSSSSACAAGTMVSTRCRLQYTDIHRLARAHECRSFCSSLCI